MTDFTQHVTGKLGDLEETPAAIIKDKVIREFARWCDHYKIAAIEASFIARQLSISFNVAAGAITDEEE